jgi:putative phage-type endonuclease
MNGDPRSGPAHDAWVQARLGKVTASRVADVMAQTKKGPSERRSHYLAELIAERLTGLPKDQPLTGAMLWGLETEPLARNAYEAATETRVWETGFVRHPEILMAGCSPDGLVGLDGLIEIKCPQSLTHVETLIAGAVPERHRAQIQWQLACTGRQWCDFVSFDPRMSGKPRLFIDRVARDDAQITLMEEQVSLFLAELEGLMTFLTGARQDYLDTAIPF